MNIFFKSFWLIINILCILAFLVQISLITYGYLVPDKTHTFSYKQDLHQMEFPVLFKICVVPGFNDSQLKKEGYVGATGYFRGESRFNTSHFGWGGHYENRNKTKPSKGIKIVSALI